MSLFILYIYIYLGIYIYIYELLPSCTPVGLVQVSLPPKVASPMAKPCSLRFPITLRIRWGKAGQSALSPLTCFATSLKHVALKLGHLQARLSNFWNLANGHHPKPQVMHETYIAPWYYQSQAQASLGRCCLRQGEPPLIPRCILPESAE